MFIRFDYSSDADVRNWYRRVLREGEYGVSPSRISLLETLVGGLKTDGVWSKLDRLWLFAAENQTAALVDLVGGTLATAVSSPTFTTDRGFTGNGSSSYIDSGFNPTVGGGHYVLNGASIFAWSNTSGTDSGSVVGFGVGETYARIFPEYTDTNAYWNVNDAAGGFKASASGASGLYLANRSASNAETLDLNGSQIDSQSVASSNVPNTNLFIGRSANDYSARQICCAGLGGSLSSGDRTAIYSRLRTFMTAIGVP